MRTAIGLFAIVLFAAALAQGGAGTGGGGGGGRGGFGQRGGMRGNMGDPFNLAMRADVQKEIGVTADQKTKLDELQKAQQDAMRERMRNAGGGGGGGSFDPAAMQAEREKMRAENMKKLEAILKPDQMKRLKEISIQVQGNRAILDPEVQKALGLSDDQKSKIKKLQDDLSSANRALMDDMRNGGDRTTLRDRMTKNNETFNTELGKLLTADQSAKLKAMGGKPFKLETPSGGGGGGL